MEDTLILPQWLKQPVYDAKKIYTRGWLNYRFPLKKNDDNMVNHTSHAQSKMKYFLLKYHELNRNRGGNNFSIPKFHVMFHSVRNICRLGAIPKYDGATLEYNAK